MNKNKSVALEYDEWFQLFPYLVYNIKQMYQNADTGESHQN